MKHFLVPIEIVLAIIFSLMLAIGCSGQTFGDFRADQPFLAKNISPASAGGCGGQSPDDLAGLKVWLDCYSLLIDVDGDAPANADELGLWGDKSGNGYDHTNATTFGWTYWTTGGPTNGPVIKPATQDDLMVNYDVEFTALSTFFFVLKTPLATDELTSYFWQSTNLAWRAWRSKFGSSPVVSQDNALRLGADLTDSAHIPGSSWVILSMHFNTNSSWIRTNGATSVSGNGGTVYSTKGSVLGNNWPAFRVYSGVINEFIVFDSNFDTNNAAVVEQYLSCKYSITNSVLHP